jgi:hypothetical protein
MAESTQPDQSAVAASFSEHVDAFHQSLPPEERALLEQIFALAESASAQQGDTQGFVGVNAPWRPPPIIHFDFGGSAPNYQAKI